MEGERQLTQLEAQEMASMHHPSWIIPALSTVLFPGEQRGPGTPKDSPEVTLMEGEALGAD